MPIKIHDALPARKILEAEGVPTISESDAIHQDIRPLQIAILNLMPDKIRTETQLARLLGCSPLQVEVTLLIPGSHSPKTISKQHLLTFYRKWQEVREQKFDGLIITGAPVEKLDFEEVFYWPELQDIFNWSQTHITQCFNICWAAQAALYHFYAIPKYKLAQKTCGIFNHEITLAKAPLISGINDNFPVPVSRYTENHLEDLEGVKHLRLLVHSSLIGPCLVEDRLRRHIYMFNHLEYDSDTLNLEYQRDRDKGLTPERPANYFPGNDETLNPVNIWRSTAHLLFRNWLDSVYAETPFEREKIGTQPLAETALHPEMDKKNREDLQCHQS